MKKYTLFLFVLFFILLGFNANSASASNCASGELFNTTTGKSCGVTMAIPTGCSADYLFSPVTGQPCQGGYAGISGGASQTSRSLTTGSKGDDVRSVQQILKDQGYYLGIIDGSYGKRTARAVRDFQYDNDLMVTGNVDVATLAKLKTFGVVTTNPSPITTKLTISEVNGPTTLNVSQKGTWTVTASDSNAGNLTYYVAWDDKLSLYPTSPMQQSSTFTHNYANSGIHKLTFYVYKGQDLSVQFASFALDVNVTDIIENAQISNINLTIATPSKFHDAKVGSYYKEFFNLSDVQFPNDMFDDPDSKYINWSVSSGSLPPGLSLSYNYSDEAPGHIITGTPTLAGNYNFSLTASPTNLSQTMNPSVKYISATKQFTLTVLR